MQKQWIKTTRQDFLEKLINQLGKKQSGIIEQALTWAEDLGLSDYPDLIDDLEKRGVIKNPKYISKPDQVFVNDDTYFEEASYVTLKTSRTKLRNELNRHLEEVAWIESKDKHLVWGDITFNPITCEVKYNDVIARFTKRQAQILELLFKNKVVSYEELSQALYKKSDDPVRRRQIGYILTEIKTKLKIGKENPEFIRSGQNGVRLILQK